MSGLRESTTLFARILCLLSDSATNVTFISQKVDDICSSSFIGAISSLISRQQMNNCKRKRQVTFTTRGTLDTINPESMKHGLIQKQSLNVGNAGMQNYCYIENDDNAYMRLRRSDLAQGEINSNILQQKGNGTPPPYRTYPSFCIFVSKMSFNCLPRYGYPSKLGICSYRKVTCRHLYMVESR